MYNDIKLNRLLLFIKKYNSAVVAFSGGTDSTFLLKICKDILGDKVTAVTFETPFHSASEIKESILLSKELDIKHKLIQLNEIDSELQFNPEERCYVCKKKLFSKLIEYATSEKIEVVFDGTNADDVSDFRPGRKALEELKIVSPLKECELSKPEIRFYSKQLNLPTFDKPANPCLATRFSTGQQISKEKIKIIDQGEEYLKSLGFKEFRLRYHENLARIEIHPTERKKLFNEELLDTISKKLKELGFKYVSMELEGYKTGSMNNA